MGPFGLVGVSTTSLEGAHLVVVDLVVHLVAQRVGNFSDRPWGISVILVTEAGRRAAGNPVPLVVVEFGVDVVDEGDWDAVLSLGADGAALVRPDGHVLWRSSNLTPDLGRSIDEALSLLTSDR